MSKKLKIVFIFLCLFFCAISMLVGFVNTLFLNHLVVAPAKEPRDIESLQAFELLWDSTITSFPIKVDDWERRHDKVFMKMKGEQIILPITKQGNIFTSNLRLTSFDKNSGEILWQIPIDFKNSYALGENSDYIFIVTEDANPSDKARNSCDPSAPFCHVLKITAIDALSGDEVWTVSQGSIRLAKRLYANDEIISVTGAGNYSSTDAKYSFDPTTGQLLFNYQPGLTESLNRSYYDELVIKSELDPDEVVSNYTENEDFIFFLMRDGLLCSIEKNTGEIVGKVQFNDKPFVLSADNYERGFSIAVIDNIVAVYLGDSEQLFSFRFSSPTGK